MLVSPHSSDGVRLEVEYQLWIRQVAVCDKYPRTAALPIRLGEGVVEPRCCHYPTGLPQRLKPCRRGVIIHHEYRMEAREMVNGIAHESPRRVSTLDGREFETRLSQLR